VFCFALFYLVPSWRGAMRDIPAGLGFIFFAFAIPYLVSQPARTRRQRASLMFFGLGGIMFFIMAVGALLPSRFADHSPGIWILEAFILPTGIAAFTVPFLFLHLANRVDRHRYGHIRRASSIAGAPRLGAGAWPQAARRDLQPTLRALVLSLSLTIFPILCA
jgi:hypothetical protein